MNAAEDREFRETVDGVSSVPSVSSTRQAWPAALSEAALHGLAGEIVRTITPHSEADPAALLVATLAAFGNACGRNAHWEIGGTRHYTNLYALQVGRTSGGRKGTAWDAVRPIFARADGEWATERVQSGLSSGEGLIHAVRDPLVKQAEHDGKTTEVVEDPGVSDKRLLAREPEFASVLRVMRRDGSTLSSTIRALWDTGDVRTLTKGKPERATAAHVSIVGDVTPDELRRELDDTSAANGFLNRFLLVCVKRSKALPFGGELGTDQLDRLADAVREALRFAEVQQLVPFAPDARHDWERHYESLTGERPGMFGAVTGRAAPQVRRLATVYALMDVSGQVKSAHLAAALALWRHCERSARFIFGAKLGDHVADRVLAALQDAGTLTRSDIRQLLGNRVTGERIDGALELLADCDLATMRVEPSKAGRPTERWVLAGVEKTDKTEESRVSSVSSTSAEGGERQRVANRSGAMSVTQDNPNWVRA